MDIDAQVKEVLAKSTMLDIGLLKDDAKLVEDFGVSSLDRIEIIMDLEEQFGIELTPEDQEGIVTVGDVIALVRQKLSAK